MTDLIMAYRRAARTASATADAYSAANDARVEADRANARVKAAEEKAARLEDIAFQSAVEAKHRPIFGASETVTTAVCIFTLAATQFRNLARWTQRPYKSHKSAATAAADSCRAANAVADALAELEEN